METVNWNADSEYDKLRNIKILQVSLAKHKITPPPTDHEQLAKGNITENLEFLRFLKVYWDSNYLTEHYDPIARRKECSSSRRRKSGTFTEGVSGISARRETSRSEPNLSLVQELPESIRDGYLQIFQAIDVSNKGTVSVRDLVDTLQLGTMRTNHPLLLEQPHRQLTFAEFVEVMAHPSTDLSATQTARDGLSSDPKKESLKLKQQLAEELKISRELEDERDFYYQKLRQVELLCQQSQEVTGDPDLVARILEILWQPRS